MGASCGAQLPARELWRRGKQLDPLRPYGGRGRTGVGCGGSGLGCGGPSSAQLGQVSPSPFFSFSFVLFFSVFVILRQNRKE